MVKEELISGMKNALARGYSIEQAKQSFINAGYSRDEVDAAASSLYGVIPRFPQPTAPAAPVYAPPAAPQTPAAPIAPAPVYVPRAPILQPAPQLQPRPLPSTAIPKKSSTGFLIVMLIIILAILLLLLGATFFFRGSILDFLKNLRVS